MKALQWFGKLVKETPIEIFLLAAIGAGIAGYATYRHESIRTKSVPVGYSEIAIIQREAERSGELSGGLTNYLTSVNDAVMDVFDAWNIAQRNGGTTRQFAAELDFKMERSFRIGPYTLHDRLTSMPMRAETARQEIHEFEELLAETKTLNKLLEEAWSENHLDHYKTELCTNIETYT